MSIFVGHAGSLERAKHHLMELDFQRSAGSQCVGGFIGDKENLADWVEPQIQEWVAGVNILAKVARKHPKLRAQDWSNCCKASGSACNK